MYESGYGIRPLRLARRRRRGLWLAARSLLVAAAILGAAVGLAARAHGGSPQPSTRVVVQVGDTLWSIAAQHYPGDDVRVRVEDIERANRLRGPQINAGQTLQLPG